MKNEILLVSDWDNSLDGVIGKVVFSDSARANFAYELLKMRPDNHRVRFSYELHPDGSMTLIGASLVSKYGKRHPKVMWWRLKDKVRVWKRKRRS